MAIFTHISIFSPGGIFFTLDNCQTYSCIVEYNYPHSYVGVLIITFHMFYSSIIRHSLVPRISCIYLTYSTCRRYDFCVAQKYARRYSIFKLIFYSNDTAYRYYLTKSPLVFSLLMGIYIELLLCTFFFV